VPRFEVPQGRGLLSAILVLAVLASLMAVDTHGRILHANGLRAIGEIVGALASPNLDVDVLGKAVSSAWTTMAYAIAGMTVGLAIGFPCGVIASGTITRSKRLRRLNVGAARGALAFFRSIHELVWAWLFVAAIGLSPMAAVLALGIPYGGILGRIFAELLQDVPEGPLRSLRSAGAQEWRVLLYGRLPMAMPDMVSYSFYRLECGIRSAAIMSFVGLGGLGQQVQLSLSDLDYGRMWTYLYFLIALIVLVDMWSTMFRRRLTE
jgi:phosphonate transport system permease protein